MNYWKTRELIQRLHLFNKSEADINELLRKAYLGAYKEVFQELRALWLSLPKNPTADMLYRNDRLYKVLNSIESKLLSLGQKETGILTNGFSSFYKVNIKGYESKLLVNVDDSRVLQAINEVWCSDGKRFSDRIWTNKQALIEYLRNNLVNTIISGKN